MGAAAVVGRREAGAAELGERARGSEPRASGVNGPKGSGWRLEPSTITREKTTARCAALSHPPHSLCSGRPGALAERPGQTSSLLFRRFMCELTGFGVPVLHGLNFLLHGVALPLLRARKKRCVSRHADLARLAGMLRMGGSVRG